MRMRGPEGGVQDAGNAAFEMRMQGSGAPKAGIGGSEGGDEPGALGPGARGARRLLRRRLLRHLLRLSGPRDLFLFGGYKGTPPLKYRVLVACG